MQTSGYLKVRSAKVVALRRDEVCGSFLNDIETKSGDMFDTVQFSTGMALRCLGWLARPEMSAKRLQGSEAVSFDDVPHPFEPGVTIDPESATHAARAAIEFAHLSERLGAQEAPVPCSSLCF
jgi:hypothetical protein